MMDHASVSITSLPGDLAADPSVPSPLARRTRYHARSVLAPIFDVAQVAVMMLATGWLAVLLYSCGPAEHAGRVVIDCARQDQARIDALLARFGGLLIGQAPDWAAIGSEALAAGAEIGGCALATFVREHEVPATGRTAPDAEVVQSGRATLEDFRSRHANNAVFRTAKFGDI